MKITIILGSLGLFATTPALADWHYVKWGMNQQQLIAASNGKAHAIEKSDYAYGRAIANTTYAEGPWKFEVQFSGSTSANVMFGIPVEVDNIRFGVTTNCEGLLPYLKAKYPLIREGAGGEFRFSDGPDEIRYHPFMSKCSFRRFKRGRY